MTFRERYLLGKTDFEEIFDLTDEWNFSDSTETLRAYLGLTEEEEDVWISDSDEALEELLLQEKNRRIFFTDLDDTLLNRQKVVTDATRSALQEMMTKGHVMVLATGRPAFSAANIAKSLHLTKERCYAIGFNGSQIVDLTTGTYIIRHSISPELIAVCAECARDFGIHLQSYTDDEVMTTQMNENLEYYLSVMDIRCNIVEDLAKALPKGAPKILAMDIKNPERTEEFRKILAEKVGDQLDLFHSSPFLLEIVPRGINKGTALRSLCDMLAIPVEHSISAGDHENDIPMIEAAGVGCAMSNGIDAIKAKADYITQADCDHDGIAEILRKFIL